MAAPIPAKGRPRVIRLARATNSRRSQPVIYTVIQGMIEPTITRVMSSLAMQGQPQQRDPPVASGLQESSASNVLSFAVLTERRAEEFIYWVTVLTNETLDSDFAIMCRYIHVLFTRKARSWYWRYHKQVSQIGWTQTRKQKQRESFSSCYEKKAFIVKASIRVEEEELLEILKSNLLSESRQKLLY